MERKNSKSQPPFAPTYRSLPPCFCLVDHLLCFSVSSFVSFFFLSLLLRFSLVAREYLIGCIRIRRFTSRNNPSEKHTSLPYAPFSSLCIISPLSLLLSRIFERLYRDSGRNGGKTERTIEAEHYTYTWCNVSKRKSNSNEEKEERKERNKGRENARDEEVKREIFSRYYTCKKLRSKRRIFVAREEKNVARRGKRKLC